MHPKTATLFGYTHDEVRKYFPGRIHALAEANGLTDDEAFDRIIAWYDGYKFEENAEPVINPVSLGCCFDTGKFANYWSKTAVPTFLTERLRTRPLDFSSLDIDESDLEAYEPDGFKPVTLLYQTGYLTIKSFFQLGAARRYTLGPVWLKPLTRFEVDAAKEADAFAELAVACLHDRTRRHVRKTSVAFIEGATTRYA